MPIPKSEHDLAALFEQLGASDPRGLAHSQATEGIPQLHRFLFLKHAWARLINERDHTWIQREIDGAARSPDAPYAGLGKALGRALSAGLSNTDLTEIARCLQGQALFAVACTLDGPEDLPPGLEDLDWGLFQIGKNGKPFGPQISALHESVLQTEPAGREMRPRSDA